MIRQHVKFIKCIHTLTTSDIREYIDYHKTNSFTTQTIAEALTRVNFGAADE